MSQTLPPQTSAPETANKKSSLIGGFKNWLPKRAERVTPAQGPQSEAAIQTWLVGKVADKLSIDPDEVDTREAFANYGLDSRAAVGLSGDLERWLGLKLSPTLVWDYPNIDVMAKYLVAEHQAEISPSAVQTPAPIAPANATAEVAAEEA